jgi:hypothetical protein
VNRDREAAPGTSNGKPLITKHVVPEKIEKGRESC